MRKPDRRRHSGIEFSVEKCQASSNRAKRVFGIRTGEHCQPQRKNSFARSDWSPSNRSLGLCLPPDNSLTAQSVIFFTYEPRINRLWLSGSLSQDEIDSRSSITKHHKAKKRRRRRPRQKDRNGKSKENGGVTATAKVHNVTEPPSHHNKDRNKKQMEAHKSGIVPFVLDSKHHTRGTGIRGSKGETKSE